jgi:multiple sugar transport system permease protein
MRAFQIAVTALVCLFVALPLLWLLYVAFLPPRAVLEARLLPTGFSLANFGALAGSGLWRALLISFATSTVAVLGQLVIGLGAAYAIRTGLRVLWLVVLALALPLELLLVPLFRLLQQLGLLDSPLALVVPFLASPLVIFLLVQALRRLPWEMVEAASLDGAGQRTIVLRIVAPALAPDLVAAGVLGFVAHWNLVLFPKVMIGDRSLWTVQVWLSELLRSRPLEWGLLGAAAFLSTLPIVLLFLLFERRVARTFERSFG